MKTYHLITGILLLGLIACQERMPVDKQATQETVDLYNRLFVLTAEGIMVGHQDDLAYGHDWYREADRSDVKDVTGDYPAVTGWELGHIELGAEYNLDSIYFSDMKRYVKEIYARGGICTFSWHGDNIATGKTAWDCDQDTVVKSILPKGSSHAKYLTWLDKVADFFLDLKDDRNCELPVVFRMYHEHTGSWFWWGAKQCTPEEYKQLWIMTVEYLRDVKNVHNLLYAYSPADVETEEQYLERYPGDEYVDIVAFDCYAYGGNNPESLAQYQEKMRRNLQIITDYAEQANKLPTIGETGMESIPDSLYFTHTLYPVVKDFPVSWVLFWRNACNRPEHFYVPYLGHSAAADFKRFTEEPRVLMSGRLGN
ncbi:MAG: glycoside hydrolase family 26 protein [Dysgonamonadaceae bacterium]|jgi:mannan endo-1,4-beta-mannosidase|nr:glycoside hydrolase family 26 protein [Dysgonamonadaceae bacterium]